MKSFDQLPDYKDLQCLWKQERIERPTPDLELTPDSGMERGAEVVGWWIARLEFWLSESGWLRAWLRFNLIVSIVLASAGLLLLPRSPGSSSSSPAPVIGSAKSSAMSSRSSPGCPPSPSP